MTAKCEPCTNGNHSGSNGTSGCQRGGCECSCRDLHASRRYACEHPSCPDRVQLTYRTESGERYCLEHFPWASDDERNDTINDDPRESNR